MRLLVVCSLIFLVGCSQKINPAFYDVVISHQEITTETNEAIINSILDDLKNNSYEQDKIDSANILIDRLQFIIKQSQIMSKYVKNESDSNTISELIKLRWNNPKEN